jgi:DNA-binding NarL/FixJ family response regulator
VTTQAHNGEQPASGPVPQHRVTVASVDDDTLIREGVARLLTGLDVVATFARVEALLDARPVVDVVLLDLSIPTALAASPVDILQGVRGVAAVVQAGYRVLIYTNERRREVLAGCLAAGAQGVVHKSEPLPAIVEAARAVACGQIVITTALTGLAEVVQRRGRLAALSPRSSKSYTGGHAVSRSSPSGPGSTSHRRRRRNTCPKSTDASPSTCATTHRPTSNASWASDLETSWTDRPRNDPTQPANHGKEGQWMSNASAHLDSGGPWSRFW